jgi:hypothetical protein
MKTCDQVAELLPALAEDVLAAAEAEEVRAHLATCAACAESWRFQELISRHFRETDLAEKPDYFWTKQRKHILQEVGFGTSRFEKAQPARRRVAGLAFAAVAAALLVAIAFAILKPGAPSTNGGHTVRGPKSDGTKGTPIVRPAPDETPKTPEAPPKNDEVVEGPAPKGPEAPPKDNPVVDQQQPPPGPEKEKPQEGIVKPAPVKPKDDKTPKEPPKEPPAAPKPEELVILPGNPRYSGRLAKEQVEILIPLTADLKSPMVKDRDTA